MHRRGWGLVGLLCFWLSAGLAASSAAQAGPGGRAAPEAEQEGLQPGRAGEPALRVTEPVESVVADLETYVPARMREAGVPGLAIALIRDYKVVWVEGYGRGCTIARRPVAPDSVFEAASMSKVVTTYIALRLVEQGKLELDAPLSVSLSEPWLPPSKFADEVTLRQLASHSSGLTENVFPTIDKSVTAEPGTRFLYTGIGFMYMQAAIQQVSGESLEQAAQELAFEPLGMRSSSFVLRSDLASRVANGHMHPVIPLLAFLIPAAVLLAAMAVLGIPVTRLRTGKWGPSRKATVGAALLAAALSLLFYALSSLNELRNFLLLIGLCGVASVAFFALAFLSGRGILSRMPAPMRGRKTRVSLGVAWMALSVVALVAVAGRITVPVPARPSPPPSAVGSLRTTAGDLGLFLVELVQPRYLSREMAAGMATPQIAAGDGFSWGLGIGIQHSAQGDALWQNAQTFGYRGLMVIYPAHGAGVVVLTNSDDGYPVACDVAGRALGGRADWEHF